MQVPRELILGYLDRSTFSQSEFSKGLFLTGHPIKAQQCPLLINQLELSNYLNPSCYPIKTCQYPDPQLFIQLELNNVLILFRLLSKSLDLSQAGQSHTYRAVGLISVRAELLW